jgi:hypothetical protein
MTIAGHAFGIEGRCSCGRRFGDISGAGPEHVNKPHWAHQGNLIESELIEIQTEVKRIWELLVGTANGSGPARSLADEIAAAEAA